MMNQALVVARKEIVDGLRDVRSVISALLFALMGPLVVGLVSLAPGIKGSSGPLVGLMSVFTLVAAFTGGMNVAMDTVAGERERRSLLPLLLNAVHRRDIVLGKWLAVSLFSIVGLTVNLLGFSVVFFVTSGMHIIAPWPLLLLAMALGIFPLPLLAASIQLLLSTACRSVKEAQTYLSMVVFLPMGVGMFLVFFPAARRGWFSVLPVLGQQLHLQCLMDGRDVPLLQSIALGCLTLALSVLVMLVSSNRLQRDEIIDGN
jgi:sodium transport system permease protein